MLVIHDETHREHAPVSEFYRGRMTPCFESPERCDQIRQFLERQGLATWVTAQDFPSRAIETVHCPDYLEFLRTIHPRWCDHLIQLGETVDPGQIEIIPHTFPTRNLRSIRPQSIHGQVGYYAMDTASPITASAWRATLAASRGAIHAVEWVQQQVRTVFSLSRPPGHHACRDSYGGYCFLNHAAVAAQHWLDRLAEQGEPSGRVAILDVDFHHGNGTQQIFYERSDVLFVSIHADPRQAYPYFLGTADETGAGEGRGANLNIPLPIGTTWEEYGRVLERALQAIHNFGPHGLVISFGADTHEEDPISGFRLRTNDFSAMGQQIASLNLPTVIIMEGGYQYSILGPTLAHFLPPFP